MKRFIIELLSLFFVVSSVSIFAENFENSSDQKSRIWNLGFDINFGEIDSKITSNFSVNGALEITSFLDLGLRGTGIWYDYRMNELDNVKTYHLESAYGGIVIEPKINITKKFKISFPIFIGSGLIQYKYDHEYLDELTWTEEIIDKETYSLIEPGINFTYNLSNKVGIYANVNYRLTSPIRLIETRDDLLNIPTAGLGFKYTFNQGK